LLGRVTTVAMGWFSGWGAEARGFRW